MPVELGRAVTEVSQKELFCISVSETEVLLAKVDVGLRYETMRWRATQRECGKITTLKVEDYLASIEVLP